jgi:DMSO/TMAO reductase YedYZ molybdopterin-dependent catalytic subunit
MSVPPPSPGAERFAGGMIVREKEPVNLETPFGSLDSFLTPVERFYVRCHHAQPRIGKDGWRLVIEGEVGQPCRLSYEELQAMEMRTIIATMECAGNGRAFLTPQHDGAQWEGGAVGTAEWTGVPLATVLALARPSPGVSEVILEGADAGPVKDLPKPAGEIHYARSLPLGKAMDDVLLALRMNGRELTPSHGFPLRAIVPGWYGMAAVKWLSRIVATGRPFHGYYQTVDYAYWDRRSGIPTLRPITTMRVKAQIARPEFAEAVTAGQPYRVHGAAWTAAAEISKVEVSTDGGHHWEEARLLGMPTPHAWHLWEFDWPVPASPGKAVVMARATDSSGHVQPLAHDDDGGSYLIHHALPVEVTICPEVPA